MVLFTKKNCSHPRHCNVCTELGTFAPPLYLSPRWWSNSVSCMVGCRMLWPQVSKESKDIGAIFKCGDPNLPWVIMGLNTKLWSGDLNLGMPQFLETYGHLHFVVSHSKYLVTIQFLGCQWCQPIADSTIPADRKKPGGPATRRALRRGDSWRYRRPSPGAYRAQLQMGSGRLEPHGQGISRAICVGKHWGQVRNGSFPNQIGPV